MKKMKKIVALLLAAVMVLGMNLNVFATEPTSRVTTGSISIANPVDDVTYKAYLMFELTTYDTAANAYTYKLTEGWKDFVTTGYGKDYFEIYDTEYVRIKKDVTVDAATLAEEALSYAETNDILAAATLPIQETDNDGNVISTKYTASNLPLGYYVVDSSLGALCNLTTLAPNSSLQEKNTIPTIEKEVLDDTDHDGVVDEGEIWTDKNDANIGDTIQYKTTVNAKKGAHDYVVHDRMGVGLTLDETSIEVMVGDTVLAKGTDYTLAFQVQNVSDPSVVCDFELTFTQEYLDSITGDTAITITYSAVLNEQALIYEEANKNLTGLDYGDDLSTEYDVTDTYTYMFDVVKTDEANKVITGAQFKLYADEACTDEIELVDGGNATYHVATEAQKATTDFKAATITINAKDKVVIKGLANGTYYLKETLAPTGYNMLTEPVKVTINGSNLKGTVTNLTYDPDAEGNNAIHVINKSGALLPETGGIGTTLFYVAGGALVLAAVVVMITRKRMSAEE